MRKLLLLIFTLLTSVSTAWADSTFTIIDNAAGGAWTSKGSYSSDNGASTWKGSWTSTSTTPQITVAADTWLLQNSTGYIGSSSSQTGKYAIKINQGYLITGYEIVFKNVNTDGSHDQTITPNGGSGQTAAGDGSATVTVTGLATRAALFNLTGANTFAKVTKFTVTYIADSYTWSSGVASNEVGGNGNYYSNTWFLKLTSPNYDDVFFDTFTLGFASDGSADDDATTYLAFTYDKFASSDNHNANEFIAISSNSISGHSSNTATIKDFTFTDKVRMNANTPVYACFVSRNTDGTYNLKKKGLAVKNTGAAAGLVICSGNNYTTSEKGCGNYQCHYTCTYSRSYDYPQASQDEYRIWSGINYADRTSGGMMTISYMKYTAPATSDKIVQFNQLSLSLRNSDVVANTYLLFSKECLTGSGVTTSTNFASSRFTAISSNCVPSANYGKVFTFTFDSDQFLHGGQTYYVYMGTKNGDNFNLQKYGLYINHEMNKRLVATGLEISAALETAAATSKNDWQPIYYSSRCSFVDPTSLLESVYTYVANYSGTSLGKYTSGSYTQEQIATALSNAETAYAGSDGSAKFLSYLTLRDIKESLTTLNMPAGNKFLRIRGNSNKCITANTETNVATLSNASDATTIFYLTSDKKLISYSNGLGLYWTHAFAAPENASLHNTFTFSEGGSTGKYTIQSNATTVHGGTVDEYLSDAGESSLGRAASVSSPSTDWTLTEITALPVTISAVKYATLYSPVALEVPEGVTAFWGENSAVDDAILVHAIKTGEVIPANNGVVLYTETGNTTYNFNITTGGSISGTNVITGTVTTKARSGEYTLQIPSAGGTPAFFGDGPANLQGFKAYLPSGSSYVMQLIFDEETVVKAIEAAMNPGKVVYDMNGRRVENPSKGLYIVNGKKVIIK